MNRRARVRVVVGLALVAALATGGVARAAAPGSLDSSFGGGVVTLGGGSQLFGVAVQSNGEIVAAGQSGGSVLVERFTTAGAADGAYHGPAGVARGVAIQPDGKIVIAGSSGGAMLVERLTPSLTPDSSFGSGGVASALGGQSAVANGVAIEPDGSIVAAGSVGGPNTRAGVARFAPNGSVEWANSPGFDNYSVINAIAVQPSDGKIVFVGQQTPVQVTDAVIGRLNPDGSLDSTFNGGAFTYHHAGGGYTAFNAVALQNDGKIVVGGVSTENIPNALFARYNTNGSPDTTFGSAGAAELQAGTFTNNPVGDSGVGIAGGGRIVGAGSVQNNGTDNRAGLWATTPTGSAESSFGSGGVVEQQAAAEACALAVAPDGSLVIAGDSVPSDGPPNGLPCSLDGSSTAFVARYVGFGPPPPPTPPGARPTVATGSASSVSEVSARVSGQVDPNGLATSYHFQYGTNTGYGSNTPGASAGSKTTTVPVTATLSGLSPGTTYHYRIAATNSLGTALGKDESFTTAPGGAPAASTGRASATEVSATISGTVDSKGLPTSYRVQYGKSVAYGSNSKTGTVRPGSSTVAVSALLSRLRPGTTYHYRLVATNSRGTAYGRDRTFKTEPRLTARLHAVAGSYALSMVAQKGLALKASCNQACSIKGSLVISASTAKQLKLGTHRLSIGSGSALRRKAGTSRLTLRLTTAAKQALSHPRPLAVTLRVVTSPVGGGKAITVSKSLTFTT